MVARSDLIGFCFFFRDDEASSAPPPSHSPSSSSPFDDLDKGTKDFIQTLLREKDKARQNYAEETKKTSRLEDQLVVVKDTTLTARAQLITADARLAGQSSVAIEKFLRYSIILFPNFRLHLF